MEKDIEKKINSVKDETIKKFYTKNGSHDWDHTERVYNMCLHIGKKEKADIIVLKLGMC
jgi:uncharacterized protein